VTDCGSARELAAAITCGFLTLSHDSLILQCMGRIAGVGSDTEEKARHGLLDCQPIPAGGREPYLKTSAAGALSARRGSAAAHCSSAAWASCLGRTPAEPEADTREDGVGSDQSAYVVEHLDTR